MKLDRKEILAIAEGMDNGQIQRVNHSSPECSGTSKSLKIEVLEDGTVHARCYRCGGWLIHNTSTKKSLLARSKAVGISECGDGESEKQLSERSDVGESNTVYFEELLSGGIQELDEWAPTARLWIRQYGITQEEIDKHGAFYSPDDRRIILPVYGVDGVVQSFQTRRVYTEDTKPKYLTYILSGGIHFILGSRQPSSCITIVEDYISGIKCARYTDVLVLHCTTLSPEHLKFLLHKHYNAHIIFLDDDNTQVKLNALKIKNLINKFSYARIIHSDGRDPKEHSDTELEELLT